MDIAQFLTEPTCLTSGCGKGGRLTRGMCTRCYRYWLDHTAPADRGPAPRFTRRFDDFVQKTHENGCWPWSGPRNEKGYGFWSGQGVKAPAHRHAWSLVNGPVPDGMWILHHCDNPPCVNPAHLYAGTVVENVRDMVTRGRSHHPPKIAVCSAGHRVEGDNVRVVRRHGKRIRTCRACDNERSRVRQAQRRASLPKPPPPTGHITTAQAVADYPMGRQTLFNWRRSGRITPVIHRDRAWWTVADLDELTSGMNPNRGRRAR